VCFYNKLTYLTELSQAQSLPYLKNRQVTIYSHIFQHLNIIVWKLLDAIDAVWKKNDSLLHGLFLAATTVTSYSDKILMHVSIDVTVGFAYYTLKGKDQRCKITVFSVIVHRS